MNVERGDWAMNFFKNNPFYWQQNPLSAEELREIGQDHYRRLSIQTKIALILTVALLSFGIISAAISYRLYMDASIEQTSAWEKEQLT